MGDSVNTQRVTDNEVQMARSEMAGMFRLLARFKLNEGIENHCSCILPDGTVLINPWGIHWTQMRRSHILRFNKAGKVIEGKGNIEVSAYMIHEAVHRLCAQAIAVIHTHSHYATALTCIENGRLEPISQLALRFWGRTSYIDEYNGLVHDPEEGERLAEKIGDSIAVFLANHGVITVGNTIGEAYNDMYFLEKACQVQILAQSTGQPFRKIDPGVIEHTSTQMDTINPDKETHFQTMLRILDKEEPDYKD